MNQVTAIQWGIVVYWIGSLADIWTTYRALKTGRFREVNPILGPLIARFGNVAMLAVKILVFIVLMLLGTWWPLVVVGVLYGAVAVRNYMGLRKLGVQ